MRRCFPGGHLGGGSSCREISAWAIAEVKERSQRLKGITSASVGLENKVKAGGASGKNLPVTAGDVRYSGLILGSGRPPGGGHGNLLSILAWKIPWTEKPSRLQSTGSSRVRHDLSNLAGTHTTLFSQPLPSAAADYLLEGTKALNRHLSYQRENSL